jgi:hypothetical protein
MIMQMMVMTIMMMLKKTKTRAEVASQSKLWRKQSVHCAGRCYNTHVWALKIQWKILLIKLFLLLSLHILFKYLNVSTVRRISKLCLKFIRKLWSMYANFARRSKNWIMSSDSGTRRVSKMTTFLHTYAFLQDITCSANVSRKLSTPNSSKTVSFICNCAAK